MSADHAPKLSIVFVNHDSPELLAKAIETLYAHRPSFPIETIVVDNASNEKPPVERFPDTRWIFNRKNRGYAAAANQGSAIAQGEYVAIANTDIEFLPGTVDRTVEFLQTHPDAGVVSPQLLWPDMTPQPSVRRFPRLKYLLAGRRSPLRRFARTLRSDREFLYAGVEQSPEPVPVEVVTGAFLGARTDFLRSLGGFDEQYVFYVEDIDLCRRVMQAGKKVYLLPQVRVVHHLGRARRRLGARAEVQRLRSFYRYFRNHYPRRLAGMFLFIFAGYLALIQGGSTLGIREWEYSPLKQRGRLYERDKGEIGVGSG